MDIVDEPMDVDLSGNSLRHIDTMDISYNESYARLEHKIKEEPSESNYEDADDVIFVKEIPPVPTVIKRYSLQRKDQRIVSNTVLSVIIAILSILSILIYHVYTFECSKELDLDALKKSLSENIIGQNQAIEHIIDSLEENTSSKILLLYGGTGVGKTLTISLILENLHHYANIYHYTMPSFFDTFSTDLMLGLTLCSTSMVIVDDLNSTDMHVKEHIKKVVEKSENLGKNITVILVFNCDTVNDQYIKKCDYSFSKHLQRAFEDTKTLKHFIKFNSLSEEHLRRCIEKELADKNLSESKFEDIIKNFNVSVDGCKGVYTKIKMLDIQ